ncbi:MAG: fibronectin type III domain-containing protein [Actinobacteria bacterium]|nr:fibronectin type III domain-containing protein [Actinomycetota bacterium]
MVTVGLVMGLVTPVAALPGTNDIEWTPLDGPGGSDGTAVAVTRDTAAVAAYDADVDGVTDAGAVRVHRRLGDGTWSAYDVTTPMGSSVTGRFGEFGVHVHDDQLLAASRNSVTSFRLGVSEAVYEGEVAAGITWPRVASDGRLLVVGDEFATRNEGTVVGAAGEVHVWLTEPDGTTRYHRLVRPGAATESGRFGQEVALAGDDIVVVGRERDAAGNLGDEEVWVFHGNGGGFTPERLPDPYNLGPPGTSAANVLSATDNSIVIDVQPHELIARYHRASDGAPWELELIEEPEDADLPGGRFATLLAASGDQILASRSDAAPSLLERTPSGTWAHRIVGETALSGPLRNFDFVSGRILLATTGGALLGSYPQPPGQPEPTARAATDAPGRIEVTWAAPSSGGTPITEYEVLAWGADEPSRRLTLPGSARSAQFDGLSGDTMYTVAVRAFNDDGPGLFGYASARTPTTPSAPRELTVQATLVNRRLQWAPPESDGRAPVLRYDILRDGVLVATVGPEQTSYDDPVLLLAATHDYEVRAVNIVGAGPPATVCSQGVLAPECDGV